MPSSFSGLDEALDWLGRHVDYERTAPTRREHPSLEAVRTALSALGDPQLDVPIVHVTGTNGKGSTTALAAALLAETGRRVGTFTSPDLHAVNERIAVAATPIDDDDLAALLARLRDLEVATSTRLTRFELLVVAALLHFADEAVEAAVVEVGVGGTWDATNVVEPRVAVVTNVSLDHVEVLGDTVAEIARDKAGIAKRGSLVVLGDEDPTTIELQSTIARDAGADDVWRRGEELVLAHNEVAVGGRLISLRTPLSVRDEVFVSMHGAHQGANALCALAAAEAFCGVGLDDELVASAFGTAAVPGRLEVVEVRPLVLLDCAHNPAGSEVLARSLEEEFHVEGRTTAVVGMLANRDPDAFLAPLARGRLSSVICCRAPSPRALEPARIAEIATELGLDAIVVPEVAHAVEAALSSSDDDDAVIVTGSFYVVGDARGHLLGLPPHRG